jgi:OmpA-OmpF porin, OOP family
MNTQFNVARSSLLVAVATILSACASTKPIDELEAARAVVPQVEASPRAGVAAANVSEARKALDRANGAAEDGKVGDAKYYANVATAHAQIANEKILTAQAKETSQQGDAERQRVLAEARASEAERANQRAQTLEEQAEKASSNN